MILDWARAARLDLARIWDFNAARSVDKAETVEDALAVAASSLLLSPRKGRLGETEGTRELSVLPIQYVLVYEIDGEVIRILRVWSTAERR